MSFTSLSVFLPLLLLSQPLFGQLDKAKEAYEEGLYASTLSLIDELEGDLALDNQALPEEAVFIRCQAGYELYLQGSDAQDYKLAVNHCLQGKNLRRQRFATSCEENWLDLRELLQEQALSYYRNNNLNAALRELSLLTESYTDYAQGWLYLGLAYRGDKQAAEAARAFSRLIELQPDSRADYYFYAASGYWESGKEAKIVLAILDKGLQRYPESPLLLRQKLLVLIAEGETSQAEKVLNQLLPIESVNHLLFYSIGRELLIKAQEQAGKRESWDTLAERALKKSLEIEPEHWESIYSLGVLAYNQASATQGQLQGLQLEAQTEGYKNLEKRYQYQLETARNYLEKASELKPEKAELWQLLSTVYRYSGEEQKAQEAEQRYRELIVD